VLRARALLAFRDVTLDGLLLKIGKAARAAASSPFSRDLLDEILSRRTHRGVVEVGARPGGIIGSYGLG